MIGTRAISGSLAIRFRKRTMAALLSSMASSMLMSMICAPFSTCWRATASACSNSPFRIIRAKAFEPVTLVRSPTLTNSEPLPISTGSRPDRRIGGTAVPGVAEESSSRMSGVMAITLASAMRTAAHPRPAGSGGWGERRCQRRGTAAIPSLAACGRCNAPRKRVDSSGGPGADPARDRPMRRPRGQAVVAGPATMRDHEDRILDFAGAPEGTSCLPGTAAPVRPGSLRRRARASDA